ncbi:MAG: arsenite methyltransferase [Planctomycetota bacterium]
MSRDDDAPCCGPSGGSESMDAQARAVVADDQRRDQVREGYAEIARSGQWSSVRSASDTPPSSASCSPADAGSGDIAGGGGGCCGPTTLTPEQVAHAVGYSAADLGALPDGANMGLSCGNPTALAALAIGEVVVDLGSGGGLDCFLAGPRVGPRGRAIGVDMTPEMLSKARANVASYRERSGLDNVEFRLGEIEHLPIGDAVADVVLSNCVLNLSVDKPQVWREIARILRPGGRVAVSDLALLQPLPEGVRDDLEALVGCIAGAQLVDDMRGAMAAAGLADIELRAKPEYIDAMTNWEDPLYKRIAAALPDGDKVADYVVSLDVRAVRPAKSACC